MNGHCLFCNIPKCKIPLSETAWVTRCMHVFCPGHGQAYFSSPSPQITCPICNELNVKEVDILHCEVNPSDMILAGISPEKAIILASKTLKLWWFQIQEQHASAASKISYLTKKNNEMKYGYNKMLNRFKNKYETEGNALKSNGYNLMKKIDELNHELEVTKNELQKYKNAYCKRNESHKDRLPTSMSPHWFQNSIGLQGSPTSIINRFGAGDTPTNEISFFNNL